MLRMRSALHHIVGLALIAGACAADEDPPVNPGPSGDSGPTSDGDQRDGTVAFDAPVADINPQGPVIIINVPDQGGLIFTTEVLVQATITDDSGLDAGSVTVSVVQDAGDPSLFERRMDLKDASANLWEARVALGGLAGGNLLIEVRASDTDDPPNSNIARLVIVHDDGPNIEFLSPSQDDQYFNSALVYSFRITYDEGTAPTGTPACGVDEVSVSGTAFSPTRTIDSPCTYEGTVDFAADFDPDLIDNQYVLLVRATNGNLTEATALRTFHVDNTGPTITFHPDYIVDNAIIGGTVVIRVIATDPSGVVAGTVVAQVSGSATDTIPLLPAAQDEYAAVYDTSELDSVIASPTISVTAEDLWGNRRTESIVVHIDNAPPVISLHPPSMRNLKVESGPDLCSWRFDPVGWDSADDPDDLSFDFVPGLLDPITSEPSGYGPDWCQPQVFFLRARVEDSANQRPGQVIIYPSYVDPQTVELFAYDGGMPLVVDLDGDGFCDNINPLLEPTPGGLPGEAWHNTMNPIPVRGTEDFTSILDSTLPIPGLCEGGTDADPPAPLCGPSPMTAASFQGSQTGVPVIFTLGVPSDGADCTGTQFDAVGNGFGSGWICLTVRARDAAGNVGISDPMRVYVDLSENNWCSPLPDPTDPMDPTYPVPDCTDGCAYQAWPNNDIFPPFPQKFIPETGHPFFPSGEIHRVN